MKGYLTPVALPHVYQHVPDDYHADLDTLVQPIPLREVAARLHYTATSYSNHRARRVKQLLGLHDMGDGWRVALTRLYYGADRCPMCS